MQNYEEKMNNERKEVREERNGSENREMDWRRESEKGTKKGGDRSIYKRISLFTGIYI